MTTPLSYGQQTATISTKHQLFTTTNAGTFVLIVDASNMALGDVMELFADAGAYPGDGHKQYLNPVFSHVQSDPCKMSIPVTAPYGVTFSLRQNAGTGRLYKWSVAAV